MLRPAPKSWLNLLCTLVLTASLCGVSGAGVIDTGSGWARASILPGSELAEQAFNATLVENVRSVARADRPVTPGALPLAAMRLCGRAATLAESGQAFPLPRSIDKLSPGAALVGIVELRL